MNRGSASPRAVCFQGFCDGLANAFSSCGEDLKTMWNFPEVTTEEFVLSGLSTPALRERAVRPRARFSTEVAKYIRDRWTNGEDVVDCFGGPGVFAKTIEKVDLLDEVFRSAAGAYFCLGNSPAEASQSFAATQLKYRRTGIRPSLPGQVAHYLDLIAFPEKDPHYHAALLVAARAELEHHSRPEYHSTYHSSDVIAATIEFLKKNNTLSVPSARSPVKLSRQELAIGIIAAAGHDIGHPGGKNALPGEKVASDPFRLERQSISIIKPLLHATGIPQKSIARIEVAILATSPDASGPGKLHREIEAPLTQDLALQTISQNLRCADLAQSCMFGLRSNEIATQDLQAEWGNRGYSDELVGDTEAEDGFLIPNGQTIKARKGFLDFVAYGESGPDAAGAKAAVGEKYSDLYADTKAQWDSVKRLEKSHAVLSICFGPATSRPS